MAALKPAALLPSPTAVMITATSQPRPIMLPARRPTLVRGSSALLALRTASSLTARWAAQAPAPVTQPRIGRPATMKTTRAIARIGMSMLRRTLTEVGVGVGAAAAGGPADVGAAAAGVPAGVGVSDGIRAWVVKTGLSE